MSNQVTQDMFEEMVLIFKETWEKANSLGPGVVGHRVEWALKAALTWAGIEVERNTDE